MIKNILTLRSVIEEYSINLALHRHIQTKTLSY